MERGHLAQYHRANPNATLKMGITRVAILDRLVRSLTRITWAMLGKYKDDSDGNNNQWRNFISGANGRLRKCP
jgi:hypothetical protein